jgi:hypothetical protein
MTLCILISISLMWTLSLLTAGNCNYYKISEVSFQQDSQNIYPSRHSHDISGFNSQDDTESFSLVQDYGPQCKVDPGPGFPYCPSGMDIVSPGLDRINVVTSDQVLDSRPQPTEVETTLNDDSIIQSYSGYRTGYPSPSQSFSSLSVAPASTIVPSATPSATTWTMRLPARPTPKPVDAYDTVGAIIEHKSSVHLRSQSGRTHILKRPWSWWFNPVL